MAGMAWTLVGNLDSPHRVSVDERGLVTLEGETWSLDWWIGAEDRWHVPAREVSVRQTLLGASPVVETRVRVPSGDAVQRVFAARDANGAEALVVEVENDTKVPFAVALAVLPRLADGRGRTHDIAIEGSVVTVDGRRVLEAGKAPGRTATATGVDGDVAAVVFAGDAADVPAAVASCSDGLAQAALVFPLAHTAVLRVVLPLPPGRDVDASLLPDVAQVVSGWQAHTRRGARVVLPDRRLQDAVDSSLRHALLRHDDVAVIAALARFGFAAEAGMALLADPLSAAAADAPGAALHALGRMWRERSDVDLAKAAAPVVAELIASLGRSRSSRDLRLGAAAAPTAAELLAAAGHRRGAKDARRAGSAMADRAAALPVAGPADATAARDRLAEQLATASATWTWDGHDLSANAALLLEVADLLVAETGGLGERVLELARVVPEAWLGQGWEVHDLPTAYGLVSYAVRWHGDRPALLWDLVVEPGEPPTRLTVPGLDPTWSSTDAKGEALLGPVAVPEQALAAGVTMPVTLGPRPAGLR